MSFITSLNSENYITAISDMLQAFEKKAEESKNLFSLRGKKLEEIMRDLPHYQSNYDQNLQDLKASYKYIENEKDALYGNLWKGYVENYSRQLSTRDIQAYINADERIVEFNRLLIDIELIQNNFAAIVDAFRQMGYLLTNITKLRVSEIQDVIL